MNFEITKKQNQFISVMANEVLFGGAAGGGKSYAQLIDAFLYAMKYPRSKQLILRRTYKELEKSLIRVSQEIYSQRAYRYFPSAHIGKFYNGSIIDFAYCDNESDVFKYQSAEYDVIRFDELTHFSETMYLYLMSRIRGANGYPKAMKSSTNPGGIGHSWVKKRFIDIGAEGKLHMTSKGSRIFIASRVQDNRFLMESDPEYIKRLENLNEKDKKALLYGDWNIFEGQFLPEFDTAVHVCKPFEIPKAWRRYIAIDYGMDMLCGLWIAVDSNLNAYVYKELYEGRDNKMGENCQGHIISEAARRIIEISGDDDIDYILAPPDLYNRRQETGKSAYDIFLENGVILTKTSNDRRWGWQSVREYLKLTKGEDGSYTARLKIFNTAINLIRTLPSLQYDPKNPQNASNTPHEITHAPDALRGFCIYWVNSANENNTSISYSFKSERPRENILMEKTVIV